MPLVKLAARSIRLRVSPCATSTRSRSPYVIGRPSAIFALVLCSLALSLVAAEAASAYGLSVSTQSDRRSAVTLGGQTYGPSSVIYVFAQPETGVSSVRFYLDDPAMSRSPRQSEYVAAYDFNGTASDGSAYGFSVGSLPSGSHTITAAVRTTNGSTDVLTGTFKVESTLVFEDNFNGSSVDTGAWSQYYSAGHAGNGLRRPSAFTVSNGQLVVTAQMVNGKIVSGGMSHRVNYRYGRFEFRVRTEVDPTGTMSGVILTWPKYQWSPEFTENDIYETGAGLNTRWPFRSFIHYGTSNSQKYFVHQADGSQWHTMAMDWRPGALKIYRDGALVWTITDTKVIPDVLHHLCIQLDARATRTLSRPVRMYVDYVRVYR